MSDLEKYSYGYADIKKYPDRKSWPKLVNHFVPGVARNSSRRRPSCQAGKVLGSYDLRDDTRTFDQGIKHAIALMAQSSYETGYVKNNPCG